MIVNQLNNCKTGELIDAINYTKEKYPAEFYKLLGERISGSKWGKELTGSDLLLLAGNSIEVTDEIETSIKRENCRYFRFKMSELCPDAKQFYTPATEIEYCFVETGVHGPELVSAKVKEIMVDFGYFITGPDEYDKSSYMVYTVYPGDLTQQPDPAFYEKYKAGDRVTREEIIAAGGANWPIKGIENTAEISS